MSRPADPVTPVQEESRTALRIVNLGGSVYSVEDDAGRLGQVRLDWDGKWIAHREGGGPIGGSATAVDRDRHGYAHRTRRDAIEHLQRSVR